MWVSSSIIFSWSTSHVSTNTNLLNMLSITLETYRHHGGVCEDHTWASLTPALHSPRAAGSRAAVVPSSVNHSSDEAQPETRRLKSRSRGLMVSGVQQRPVRDQGRTSETHATPRMRTSTPPVYILGSRDWRKQPKSFVAFRPLPV